MRGVRHPAGNLHPLRWEIREFVGGDLRRSGRRTGRDIEGSKGHRVGLRRVVQQFGLRAVAPSEGRARVPGVAQDCTGSAGKRYT